jgi:hypothetical protein
MGGQKDFIFVCVHESVREGAIECVCVYVCVCEGEKELRV